ncbi:unnamed protein product, partial [Urochloa humidicola]
PHAFVAHRSGSAVPVRRPVPVQKAIRCPSSLLLPSRLQSGSRQSSRPGQEARMMAAGHHILLKSEGSRIVGL